MSENSFRNLHYKKVTTLTLCATIGVFLCGFLSKPLQNVIITIFFLGTFRTFWVKKEVIKQMDYLFKIKLQIFIITMILIVANQKIESVFILSLVVSLTTLIVVFRFVNYWATLSAERMCDELCAEDQADACLEENIKNIEELKDILDSVHQWFQNTECYLDSDYSINHLEKDLVIDKKHISLAINRLEGSNFYNFIAFYRIKHAKKIILDNDKYTLETLSLECGFYSKSTFNKYFKIFEGQTPSSFKLKHL